MASDLRRTPRAGLTAQLCGDAHLSNFGMFASPERVLLVDLNDFDETLPGPFEYDVKRLETSFTIEPGTMDSPRQRHVMRRWPQWWPIEGPMSDFARMRTLDIWYARHSERS
jgi:hypothetical protein